VSIIKAKISAEIIIVFLFFWLLVWTGLGQIYDNKLAHDFPHGDFASDAFQHNVKAQYIKDQGNYRQNPFYASAGLPDIIGFYPPLLYHVAVMYSTLTGLEVFDTLFFTTIILVIFSIFLYYLIITSEHTISMLPC